MPGIRGEAHRPVSLRRVAAEDEATRGGFRPAEFEVLLEGEIAGIRFHGKADRIDVRPDGSAFRVLDYKRSKSKRYSHAVETGIFEKRKYLQLPIYYLLASQKFPAARLEDCRAAYAFIEKEPEFKELDGSFLERRREFEELVRAYLAQIRAGKFGLRVDDHCAHCDFRFICRRNHIPTRRRAAHES
jgi:RecB family exonuclease